MSKYLAVLSSTVLTEGTFTCVKVDFPTDLAGVVHYVGHPATKALVEALGATQASEKLFKGLEVGQSYLATPLAQNPRAEGWTKDTAVTDASQLKALVVTRIA